MSSHNRARKSSLNVCQCSDLQCSFHRTLSGFPFEAVERTFVIDPASYPVVAILATDRFHRRRTTPWGMPADLDWTSASCARLRMDFCLCPSSCLNHCAISLCILGLGVAHHHTSNISRAGVPMEIHKVTIVHGHGFVSI